MWDTIQKLEYRSKAGILDARQELERRLSDQAELPLPGIHGEKLILTGVTKLCKRSTELNALGHGGRVQKGEHSNHTAHNIVHSIIGNS